MLPSDCSRDEPTTWNGCRIPKAPCKRQVWRASQRIPQLKLKAVFVFRNKVFTILGFLIQSSICFSPKFFWSLARSRIFQMPLYQKMRVCSFLCRNMSWKSLESVRPAPPSREIEMTLPASQHSSYFKLFTILFLRPKSNDSPLWSRPQPPSSELITPFLCFPNTSQPWSFKGFFYPATVRFTVIQPRPSPSSEHLSTNCIFHPTLLCFSWGEGGFDFWSLFLPANNSGVYTK